MANIRTTYYSYVYDNIRIQHSKDTEVDVSGFYYQPHTHDNIELTYIIEADGFHAPEDKEYKLRKNDLVITPPSTFHRMKLKPGSVYERYNLSISAELLKNINLSHIFKHINVINCTNYTQITDIFKKTDFYANNLNERQFEDVATMLIKEIFYNLSIYNGSFDSEAKLLNPILSKAINYINNNLFDIKSISEISHELYITDSYLYEIFKKHLKLSPKKYIISKRLYIARNEILLGKKPTEVYSKFGFSDYSSFYRSYVSLFGYSPSKEI